MGRLCVPESVVALFCPTTWLGGNEGGLRHGMDSNAKFEGLGGRSCYATLKFAELGSGLQLEGRGEKLLNNTLQVIDSMANLVLDMYSNNKIY